MALEVRHVKVQKSEKILKEHLFQGGFPVELKNALPLENVTNVKVIIYA